MAAGYIMPQSNFTATVDPTVNDDVTLGYSTGSPWVNTATGYIFVLVDPSPAAADWQQVYPVALTVTTITADTTLATSQMVLLCDATSGAFTVTLPATASNSGRRYFIKKVDSSANSVTIDADGDELIDDALTAVLTAQYEAVLLVCDGSNWVIL